MHPTHLLIGHSPLDHCVDRYREMVLIMQIPHGVPNFLNLLHGIRYFVSNTLSLCSLSTWTHWVGEGDLTEFTLIV